MLPNSLCVIALGDLPMLSIFDETNTGLIEVFMVYVGTQDSAFVPAKASKGLSILGFNLGSSLCAG